MASLWQTVTDSYHDIMDNKSDSRVNAWPLMSGPLPTLMICISYAYFVKVIGPKLMENRKPFSLRRFMIFYNLFQVIFSTWLFYGGLKNGWWNDYSFKCQPVDYSNNPKAMGMAEVSWWYYMSKFTEFFDTFLFVLRKKNDHISTLHVIHHGIMPISTWFGVKFSPGGHSTFFGLLNTFVHIIMYGYYLLAALGPKIQPYLWWKKYLTSLQMIQFVLVMIHAFQLLFIECNYSKAFVWWIGMHSVLFFYLFRDFYIQAYIKRRDSKAAITSSVNKENTVSSQNGYNKSVPNSIKSNGVLYPNTYKMATGYISTNGLKNRVFIDNHTIEQ
ncbi:hypothetical protein PV327_004303 [Microctonus hyperodae]|uniref:Elongation of very long chain fatty acids protein n=1 Tax=Microctonus hyperodae TaxID=165561 RepID=A0AA39FC69_MICHY|nr:hypothetical protein PV327_004303 [Microctonus hyperodae]